MSKILVDPKLSVELVPSSSWGQNVRSVINRRGWRLVRERVLEQANYTCEICGNDLSRRKDRLHCHEIWDYQISTEEYRKGKQVLTGLQCLCHNCHEVKHIGLAFHNNRGDQATTHLADVNGWSNEEAIEYVLKAFAVWEQRSLNKWELDLRWLYEFIEKELIVL